MNRITEIEERLSAIKAEIEADGADLTSLEAEVRSLNEERKSLNEQIEQRKKIVDNIVQNAPVVKTFEKEERKQMNYEMMSVDEVMALPEYRSAFLKALQGKPLTDIEKRLTVNPNTAAAVVPTITSEKFFTQMTRIAPMLSEILLFRVAGNMSFTLQTTRNAAAVHVEKFPAVDAAEVFTTVTLAGFEFLKIVGLSATVATMGIDAFEDFLVDMLATDIAIQLDSQIINGGSVTGNISAAQVWGAGNQVTYVPGTLAYSDLTSLIALLPAQFDYNAKFVMRKATFFNQVLNVLDANGNPIVVQDIASPSRYSIMGYPVLIDDNVGANEAYFGDFKQVVGNLSQDIKVDKSLESSFRSNQVDYRGTAIFDCNIANPTAIVKLNI